MNDRAVAVLEQYEMEVDKLRKGRGSFLFDSDGKHYLMEEYKATEARLEFVANSLNLAYENGIKNVERIFPNKEGELLSKDYEDKKYIVKSHFSGKECDLTNEAEAIQAVKALAQLHNDLEGLVESSDLMELPLEREMKKHNRELQKVRKFLKNKGQKSEFELFLLQYYDFYFNQAKEVLLDFQKENLEVYLEEIRKHKWLCHGDFQHHNVIIDQNQVYFIHFERMLVDNPIRDLYQFLRKLLEKNEFNPGLYKEILNAYSTVRKLKDSDLCQLKYRFCYPEKFWKIVNFYYNNSKAWMSYKNKEKLEKFLRQEEFRQDFIKEVFTNG